MKDLGQGEAPSRTTIGRCPRVAVHAIASPDTAKCKPPSPGAGLGGSANLRRCFFWGRGEGQDILRSVGSNCPLKIQMAMNINTNAPAIQSQTIGGSGRSPRLRFERS